MSINNVKDNRWVWDCENCGEEHLVHPDVQLKGDVTCRYCNNWYNIEDTNLSPLVPPSYVLSTKSVKI